MRFTALQIHGLVLGRYKRFSECWCFPDKDKSDPSVHHAELVWNEDVLVLLQGDL